VPPMMSETALREMYTYAYTVMTYTNRDPEGLTEGEAERLQRWATENPQAVLAIQRLVDSDIEHYLTEYGFRKKPGQ
jgi:hypothetical protein